jgi:hypothetical protein
MAVLGIELLFAGRAYRTRIRQNPRRRFNAVRLFLLGSISLISLARSTRADAIYTYSGNPLAESGGLACASGCSITATLTFAQPLGANFSGVVVPSSFVLADGSASPLYSSQAYSSTFILVTDSSGNIVNWEIYAVGSTQPPGDVVFETFNLVGDTPLCNGACIQDEVIHYFSSDDYIPLVGFSYDAAGSWTSSDPLGTDPSDAPEPSGLSLLGVEIIGLLGLSCAKSSAS